MNFDWLLTVSVLLLMVFLFFAFEFLEGEALQSISFLGIAFWAVCAGIPVMHWLIEKEEEGVK